MVEELAKSGRINRSPIVQGRIDRSPLSFLGESRPRETSFKIDVDEETGEIRSTCRVPPDGSPLAQRLAQALRRIEIDLLLESPESAEAAMQSFWKSEEEQRGIDDGTGVGRDSTLAELGLPVRHLNALEESFQILFLGQLADRIGEIQKRVLDHLEANLGEYFLAAVEAVLEKYKKQLGKENGNGEWVDFEAPARKSKWQPESTTLDDVPLKETAGTKPPPVAAARPAKPTPRFPVATLTHPDAIPSPEPRLYLSGSILGHSANPDIKDGILILCPLESAPSMAILKCDECKFASKSMGMGRALKWVGGPCPVCGKSRKAKK